MMKRRLLTASAFVACVSAQPAADEITSLPEFGAPPSKHYSGYLEGLNNSKLHYYMAYAEDVDPATAPVIYWTNGGPGCSSMVGWGYEHGPFQFRQPGESSETYPYFDGNMKRNPFSWNKKANVVYVEQPPGVGFSYNPDGGSYSINDYQNQANNYAAIKDMFKKFSNFAKNDFYLTGESYAGVYIPMMAQAVLDGDDENLKANLKGMLVGNGLTTNEYPTMLDQSQIQTFFQGLESFSGEPWIAPFSLGDINPYNLVGHYYNPPAQREQEMAEKKVDGIPRKLRPLMDAYLRGTTGKPSVVTQRLLEGVSDTDRPPLYPDAQNELALPKYLNMASVQKAMHVEPAEWGECSAVGYHYHRSNEYQIPTYNNMQAAGKKVLIYSGTVDGAVPWTTQAHWIPENAKWNVTRSMQPWSFDDASYPYGPQMGGAAMQFQGKTEDNMEGGIWFTTMRGCGHMVPQDCPAAAAEMLDRALTGKFWDEPKWQTKPYQLKSIEVIRKCSGKDE